MTGKVCRIERYNGDAASDFTEVLTTYRRILLLTSIDMLFTHIKRGQNVPATQLLIKSRTDPICVVGLKLLCKNRSIFQVHFS